MNSDEIQKRQNEEGLLKVQYAARVYYNRAEIWNYLAWIMCVISAFSSFLPDNLSSYILTGVPLSFDILAILFSSWASKCVENASYLRKYFDSYVLNIKYDRYSDDELRKIREMAELKYSKKASIQINNTGNDSLPGVRDWYNFTQYYDGINSQFECQKQNAWWNSKMITFRIIATSIITILAVVAIMLLLRNNNFLNILLCFSGVLIKLVERIKENWKCLRICDRIDGARLALDAHPTKEGIEKLQELIDMRRSIVVLESNLIHKLSAKKLSKLYENITSQ